MRWCNETFFYVLGTCAIGGAAIASALSVNMEDAVHPEFRMGLLAPRQAATKTNLQTFTGALGDIKASAIQSSGNRDKPFEVDSETFNDFKTAANRACDNQFNGCQRFANDNQKKPGAFTVGDCDKQNASPHNLIAGKRDAPNPPQRQYEPLSVFPDNFAVCKYCENVGNAYKSEHQLQTTSFVCADLILGPSKTSSAQPSPQTPPRAFAQDGCRYPRARPHSPAASPALSSASTADGEASSPELPPLPPPPLPDRVRGLLRTPPRNNPVEDNESTRDDAAHWGSPYPPHLRRESLSSEASEDSLIHHLELQTPFLRPVPLVQDSQTAAQTPEISAAAAVLANRARRVRHGITEDWIRQHTSHGNELEEKRNWFSDGTGDSENSSLSGSFSGEDAAWLEHSDILTPRANRQHENQQLPPNRPRKKSSSETLKQALLNSKEHTGDAKMASSGDWATPDSASDHAAPAPSQEPTPSIERPSTPKPDGEESVINGKAATPITPSKSTIKWAASVVTPRIKKKVPWKGKNIMVLLPRDDERGQPGKAPKPLTESEVEGMMRSWDQLGYNTRGFDLDTPPSWQSVPGEQSQSRGAWPDFDEVARERKQGNWNVLLPDLNAWKRYVDELNEAKLRALGVSFGDEDPPAPSMSPASTLSRQASVTQYPPLPFSPPLPTSSASSNHANQGFPFPGSYGTSAPQSPGILSGASPSFGGKYNPRASISIPSPHGWSPHMMLHQGHRAGSPSLANLHAMMSPTSPFSVDGMHGHQRHQSLQFPVLPPQFQQQARASPRLQELREVDEEPSSKSPSKTPEPALVRHNASNSLQREIDEAEYHLEEQMRSQLDNDEDYSPHNQNDDGEAAPASSAAPQATESTVQFAPQPPRFGADADNVVLHHPRPHSRGHSLSQKYFTEDDVSHDGGFKPTLQGINTQSTDESEIETNPSNLGTPVQAFDFSKLLHQRSFSTTSNPWTDNESGKSANGSMPRRSSHSSKASVSKLNVDAPEFKFNPTNTFQPGKFVFSSNTFQPAVFNAGLGPNTVSSNQFSLPSTTSKINVNAPVFSPGQSDFNFSSSGPKFRPDAPAFTPHSLSNSVSQSLSGGEGASIPTSSIFGNIDLSKAEIIVPAKKSKAVPIVRPDIDEVNVDTLRDGPDGRPFDDSRYKRARATDEDDNAVPLFADQPTEEATPVPESRLEKFAEEEVPMEDKSFDESNLGQADTILSSTMVSETTNSQATVSPTATSPDQASTPWAPFEFNSALDLQAFNDARPMSSDMFRRGHKKSLSATAKAFVPRVSDWAAAEDDRSDTGEFGPPPDVTELEKATQIELAEESQGDTVDNLEEEIVVESIETPVEEVIQEQPKFSPTTVAAFAPAPPPMLPPPQLAPTPSLKTVAPRKGLAASRFARIPSPPPEEIPVSRFAATPSPVHDEVEEVQPLVSPLEPEDIQESLQLPAENLSPASGEELVGATEDNEPSLADIDAIMRHLNENPNMGVNKTFINQPDWHQPSPTRPISIAAVTRTSPLHLPPQIHFRSDAPSPSPGQFRPAPVKVSHPLLSTEVEDPFIDPPHSALSIEGPIHRLNGSESLPASDWDGTFSEDEQGKLEARVNFFNGHVNEIVGGLLAARLGPLEQTLDAIKHALGSRESPSSRRERRSLSAEIRESDADDEDDDMPMPRRSMSPRRDRKLEQIRSAVLDAMTTHQRNVPNEASLAPAHGSADNSAILTALEEMRNQFSQSLHLDFRGEDLKMIVEEAVESRLPPTPQVDNEKVNGLEARILELEQRLKLEETKVETEAAARRAAEDRAADLNRELQSAATKIEVEMMNKSALNQRISDVEDRVHQAEHETEEAVKARRAAEDRISEIQRLLRISSEEELRLRDLTEEKEQKVKSIESTHSKNAMRLTLLEAAQSNAQQSQSEAQNRINNLEADLREARQEARHWRSETDRLAETSQRHESDFTETLGENKAMRKLIDTLGTQLQENERVRDSWRSKFVSLQEEMAQAAREITEENSRRTKKEQALLARQEVLDARLQAEARTRERIETELERLEMGERQGMRAVSECKRLETLLAELRIENSTLQQNALRYQAEFQEARESGAREVQRTRESMQAEVESANHQVNVVREELDTQMSSARAQLDQVRMDADTARARYEMLLEEVQNSKKAELEDLVSRHQNEIEDLQARYERKINNTTEDAQRAEQNLLERLSISTSKSEHLQDKVAHLEEKLEIAKEAAKAAVQAVKLSAATPEPAAVPKAISRSTELPEKISPQALRESIMVLQEQLQEREHRIEELEQALSKADPDAELKISKRDDEIIWLRELLAVRHSDLQDIIAALRSENYDINAVKDAAIRLKANLQMEEQERERAMNGGSSINLPNIAATLRDAATPRVAQAVGPLAAAWGNWRKGRDPGSFGSLSGVLSSPNIAGSNSSTPSKNSPGSSSFLGGLLTPPASGLRQTPPTVTSSKQPTAFSSTGRRFTAQDLVNRPRGPSTASVQENKTLSVRGTPPRRGQPEPMTPPPVMRTSAYDSDAQAEDFDDAGFFDD
ncbi:hypothetical protein B0H63DRAFT_516315 [Podospora didyma]|uniref:Myosin class II heavy chain n=1 Tax=Podospora didyma TaxID=330526 RepID=A0AAE0P4F3_9PEZI|nr:hypothetical protein B0H63DRAFT_516315 [Podospora didyma]